MDGLVHGGKSRALKKNLKLPEELGGNVVQEVSLGTTD